MTKSLREAEIQAQLRELIEELRALRKGLEGIGRQRPGPGPRSNVVDRGLPNRANKAARKSCITPSCSLDPDPAE